MKTIKNISKENCILCIFEYVKFRKDLNKESLQIYWGSDKRIPKLHDIGFTYFVGGEFRKDKFYNSKQILTNKLCKSLISDNKDNLKFYKVFEKEIDNILHKRNFKFTKLKYNKEFERFIKLKFFSKYKKVNLKDIWCGMFEYNEGDGYDRHVETIKGLSLDDKEQYQMIYDFTLNDDYEGGEVEIYDEWYKNDRETFTNKTKCW